MARPRLFLHDSVGPGRRPANRSGDVIAVKQRLSNLGFYQPPPEGFGDDIDAGFYAAVRAFQTDNGLQIDGRLEPGGETERNLAAFDDDAPEEAGFALEDLALSGRVGARGENAKEDVTQVKQALAELGRYPLDRTSEPPPFVDTKLVEAIRELQRDQGLTEDGFIDPDGETLDALKKSEGRPGTRPGETEVAFLGALGRGAIKHGPAAYRQLKKTLRDMGILKGGDAAIELEKRRQEKDRQNPSNRDPSPPLEPNPPFPGDPIKPDNVEKFPEDRPADNSIEGFPGDPDKLPDRTEFPAAPKLPNKVIYESLEDDEFWRQAHIFYRAGNARTRRWNTVVADYLVELGKQQGIELEVISGGFDKYEKYRKEFPLPPHEDLKVEGSPNRNRSWLDIAVQIKHTKTIILINTVDIYLRTGELKPREEWQRVKVLKNKTSDHHFMTVPKTRNSEQMEEVVKRYKEQFHDMLERLKKVN
ncbi:MAG: peptidoglycan hydrolase-like protein with peptidoglycan-binding domain [Alphaproteobacteria bacterium]|jgi:peptidoglycan hydrolase-like protein with peptidoglycan-binding domain